MSKYRLHNGRWQEGKNEFDGGTDSYIDVWRDVPGNQNPYEASSRTSNSSSDISGCFGLIFLISLPIFGLIGYNYATNIQAPTSHKKFEPGTDPYFEALANEEIFRIVKAVNEATEIQDAAEKEEAVSEILRPLRNKQFTAIIKYLAETMESDFFFNLRKQEYFDIAIAMDSFLLANPDVISSLSVPVAHEKYPELKSLDGEVERKKILLLSLQEKLGDKEVPEETLVETAKWLLQNKDNPRTLKHYFSNLTTNRVNELYEFSVVQEYRASLSNPYELFRYGYVANVIEEYGLVRDKEPSQEAIKDSFLNRYLEQTRHEMSRLRDFVGF